MGRFDTNYSSGTKEVLEPSGTREVLITVRSAPVVDDKFKFDVWADNGKIKVGHGAADPGRVVQLGMDESEISVGCTTVTLQAFELIRKQWEQYRAAKLKEAKHGRRRRILS